MDDVLGGFIGIINKKIRDSMTGGIGIGVLQVAEEMAKYKVPDEDIMKVTCLSKEELRDLKLLMPGKEKEEK